MPEHASPEFKRRYGALPEEVCEMLSAIAESTVGDSTAEEHARLLEFFIGRTDALYGEAVRIEMGWCLEQMDDVPISEWVRAQKGRD